MPKKPKKTKTYTGAAAKEIKYITKRNIYIRETTRKKSSGADRIGKAISDILKPIM